MRQLEPHLATSGGALPTGSGATDAEACFCGPESGAAVGLLSSCNGWRWSLCTWTSLRMQHALQCARHGGFDVLPQCRQSHGNQGAVSTRDGNVGLAAAHDAQCVSVQGFHEKHSQQDHSEARCSLATLRHSPHSRHHGCIMVATFFVVAAAPHALQCFVPPAARAAD